MDIEASARTHGVTDDDMIDALRHHWRAFETDNPAVRCSSARPTRYDPLEIGVVTDDDGTAVIHAIPARSKFLQGWWTP
jgi:hypothetical protein